MKYITAKEFVEQDYAGKIERGECEIWDDFPYSHVVKVEHKAFNDEWPYTLTIDKDFAGHGSVFGINWDYTMRVDGMLVDVDEVWLMKPLEPGDEGYELGFST